MFVGFTLHMPDLLLVAVVYVTNASFIGTSMRCVQQRAGCIYHMALEASMTGLKLLWPGLEQG